MTPPVEQTRECPSCGQTLTEGEKSCIRCGNEIPEVTKKPAKAKKAPSKATKVACPHCGEPVSKRSRKCPACMTNLPAGFYKTPTKSVEIVTVEPKTEPAEQAIQVAGDEGNSDSSNVPMVLARSEPTQEPAVAAEVAKPIDTIIPVEATPVLERHEKEANQVETAELVTPLEPAPAKEPAVKIEEESEAAGHASSAEFAPPVGPSGTGSGTAETVEPDISSDPMPAEDLPRTVEEDKMPVLDPVSIDFLPAEPSKTIDHDQAPECGGPQIDPDVAQVAPETFVTSGVGISTSSKVCEAIVPKSSLESVADLLSAIEKSQHADQVQPTAGPLQAQQQAEAKVPVDNAASKPVRLVRKRKLKLPRSTAPPIAASTDVVAGDGARDVGELGKMISGNAGDQAPTK